MANGCWCTYLVTKSFATVETGEGSQRRGRATEEDDGEVNLVSISKIKKKILGIGC